MEEDFEPLFRSRPFLDTNGPFYQRRSGDELIVGIRVLDKHVNGRGYAHAGILMTLADISIGYQAAFSEKPPLNLVTISLNNDFMSSAKLGDWLTSHIQISKKGENILYASATIMNGEEKVVRCTAIYRVLRTA